MLQMLGSLSPFHWIGKSYMLKLNLLIFSGFASSAWLYMAQMTKTGEGYEGLMGGVTLIGVLVWIINLQIKREKELQAKLDHTQREATERLEAAHKDFIAYQKQSLASVTKAMENLPCIRDQKKD